MRVRDAATGNCVRVMENLTDCISSVARSPLGDMLACASLTSVHVWDGATGTKPKHTLQPCEVAVENRGMHLSDKHMSRYTVSPPAFDSRADFSVQ